MLQQSALPGVSPFTGRCIPRALPPSSAAECTRFRLARPCVAISALPPQGEEISDAMKADLERYRRQEALQRAAQPASSSQQADGTPSPSSGIKELVDKANTSGTGSSPVLDAWYPLWPSLWQGSIGLLMAGALTASQLHAASCCLGLPGRKGSEAGFEADLSFNISKATEACTSSTCWLTGGGPHQVPFEGALCRCSWRCERDVAE
ncbi:uncharacterized protein HaLaN_06159 [Haematococcus lacustris]|uniref:Uncharacterized protein n=1 Tax=Haematococcus lacustris TaxID=44745 RepID=A0A699Z5R8_HAELA|nr:uncharacterized protein HaLaN_06159 [Haematococcus lacustris]